MLECPECYRDVTKLHEDGRCQGCHELDEDRYKGETRGDFPWRQTVDLDPIKTYVCKKCGGDRFIVGSISYTTSIKCPTCKWEQVVHDG